jgi:hypothetical protein
MVCHKLRLLFEAARSTSFAWPDRWQYRIRAQMMKLFAKEDSYATRRSLKAEINFWT